VTSRHDRQERISGWSQDRLAAATVVVAGVGALGNEVLKNLALQGVGRLLICDPDSVAPSNLSRTVLFETADVGRPKVEAAAAALARLAPKTRVTTRHDDLRHGVGLGELADADLVVGALDSRPARLELLSRCALAAAPLVDGGTRAWGGEVRVRVNATEPCYGCTLGTAELSRSDLSISCGGDDEAPEPSSIISTTLVAGWMTAAATRILMAQPLLWRFLHVDAADGTAGPFTATRNPGCFMHEPVDSIDRTEVGSTATVGDLLGTLPAGAEPISWSLFATAGDCPHCGGTYHPGHRALSIDCSHCGAWVRPRLSQRLRDADPKDTLREVGIPPAEIIAIRLAEGGYRWLRMSD
jgi:molybdopterin/thiamine biosynthesis adenylyltransferase